MMNPGVTTGSAKHLNAVVVIVSPVSNHHKVVKYYLGQGNRTREDELIPITINAVGCDGRNY